MLKLKSLRQSHSRGAAHHSLQSRMPRTLPCKKPPRPMHLSRQSTQLKPHRCVLVSNDSGRSRLSTHASKDWMGAPAASCLRSCSNPTTTPCITPLCSDRQTHRCSLTHTHDWRGSNMNTATDTPLKKGACVRGVVEKVSNTMMENGGSGVRAGGATSVLRLTSATPTMNTHTGWVAEVALTQNPHNTSRNTVLSGVGMSRL